MSAVFTDADLAAFMDGTLEDDALIAAIEAAINADPALADRAEALAASDDTAASVRAAFAPVLDAPVPDRLTRIVAPAPQDDAVANLAAARADRRPLPAPANDTGGGWRWPQFAAMAASLVLGVVIGGPLISRGGGGEAGADGALVLAAAEGPVPPSAVATMLDTAPSGQTVDLASLGTGEVVLTFRNADGALCRQFTLERSGAASDALACAGTDGGWQVEAFGRRAAPSGEMKLAGGDAAPGVVAAVDAMIASDPLLGPDEIAELGKR